MRIRTARGLVLLSLLTLYVVPVGGGCALDPDDVAEPVTAELAYGSGSGSGAGCKSGAFATGSAFSATPANDCCVCPDDGNECTDDVCDASGQCTHPAKAAGTACTADRTSCTGDVCDGSGRCAHQAVANGTACAEAERDRESCTDDVCYNGACTHPGKADDSACDDEPDARTTDMCCASTCRHRMSSSAYASRSGQVLDPNMGGYPPGAAACVVALISASIAGPGGGARAEGAEYTFTVTITINYPSEPHCANVPTNMRYWLSTLAAAGFGTTDGTTFTHVERKRANCAGGTLDFQWGLSGQDLADGGTFSSSAHVTLGTSCCRIDTASAVVDDMTLQNPATGNSDRIEDFAN